MSREFNPYSPPESASQNESSWRLRSGRSATRFGVVGNKVHCDQAAVLPEICIATGTEADLIRLTKTLNSRNRVSRWIPCFVLPGLPWFSWLLIAVGASALVIRHYFINHTGPRAQVTYSITRAALQRNRILATISALLIPVTLITSWVVTGRSIHEPSFAISGVLIVAEAIVADYFYSDRLTVALMGIRHRCVLKGFSKSFLNAAQLWLDRNSLDGA